jgi:hypothetical protein
VEGDGVLDEPVSEEVEELTTGAEAAGTAKVELVVDLAVSGLSVASPPHQAGVVGIAGRNLADVAFLRCRGESL